jgi:hypothetical protein
MAIGEKIHSAYPFRQGLVYQGFKELTKGTPTDNSDIWLNWWFDTVQSQYMTGTTTLDFTETVNLTFASHQENIIANTTLDFTDSVNLGFASQPKNITGNTTLDFTNTVDVTDIGAGTVVNIICNSTLDFIESVSIVNPVRNIEAYTTLDFTENIYIENVRKEIQAFTTLNFTDSFNLGFTSQIKNIQCNTILDFTDIFSVIEYIWVTDLIGQLRNNNLKVKIYDE